MSNEISEQSANEPIPGATTLELVEQLTGEGVEHIVLLMRHSAREFAPGKHDLLNPLTDEGRELARLLGAGLPKSMIVRGYSSPAERCVETADLIMTGHRQNGGDITRNRVIEALGVFYVLDQMKMFMAMRGVEGMVPMLASWFKNEVSADIMMPADLAAGLLGRLVAEKLKDKPQAPQLDLMVSHDFTLFTLKDRLLGQDIATHPEVRFLDGIAFFIRDGVPHIQSHHGPAIELRTDLVSAAA